MRQWTETSQFPFSLVAEVPGSVSSYDIGYLFANTKYEFRVRAMNPVALCSDDNATLLPGSNSDPVDLVSGSVIQQTSQPTLPGAPAVGFQVDQFTTGGKIGLEWTIPHDTGGVHPDTITYSLSLMSVSAPPLLPKADSVASSGWLKIENTGNVVDTKR